MSARKQFTPECKREAVQLAESGSRPASAIARELGVRLNLPSQSFDCRPIPS